MRKNEFVKALLKENEGEQMALFSDFELDKIGETVCAFLNTKGGRLLVGFDKQRKLIYNHELASNFNILSEYIYKNIIPESLIGIRKEDYEGTQVVLIEVIEGSKKPYSINNNFFVRKGTKTILADNNDISNLIRSRKNDEYSWEKLPVLEATLDDLDLEEISKTIEKSNLIGRASKFEVNDPKKFLLNFQLFKNNQITNAAIVLFAKEPTFFLPQCRIRIIDFGKGKTSTRFENTVIIEQNLFKAFLEIQTYFKRNIPIISEFKEDNWIRKDRFKYPNDALDEAVINALIHRDYSDVTGEVFIGIYPDKIEIKNSGQLPNSLTVQDLKRIHNSYSPNPDITHLVYLCGIIEKVGRGTQLIIEKFSELNLKPPQWISKNGSTTIILNSETKKIEVNERMLLFLKQLTPEFSFSREGYMSFFNNDIQERTARMDLQKLIEGGWVTKIGDGPQTKYFKTTKKLPDIAG